MSFDKEISREDQDEINNFTKYFMSLNSDSKDKVFFLASGMNIQKAIDDRERKKDA